MIYLDILIPNNYNYILRVIYLLGILIINVTLT